MITLLLILLAIWWISSNIKWALIAMAAFMLMIGSCRRRGDEYAEKPQPQVIEQREVSATGLPIAHKQYYATEPGQLSHDREW